MDRQKIERSIKGLSEWQMHVQAESDIDTNISTAIEALKAQLSREGTTSDLISKTETVEHLRRVLEATVPNTDYDEGYIDGIEFGISTVSTMPSAQPVATDTNVGNNSEIPNSSDCISRQQAIDEIKNYCKNGCDIAEDNWCPSCQREQFIELLKVLPSAQPDLDEWCTDCREYNKDRHSCPRWNRVIRQTVEDMKAAQPELTDEQAITHLQSSGWMQRHDKEMYESELREQLADDSDSYDSLLQSVQSDLIEKIQAGITATNLNDAYSLGMRNGMRWCKSLIDGAEPQFEDVTDTAELLSAQHEPQEGHWIPHESPDGGVQYECSECGVLWEFNDGSPEDNEAYFCPKCGAKMKGADT